MTETIFLNLAAASLWRSLNVIFRPGPQALWSEPLRVPVPSTHLRHQAYSGTTWTQVHTGEQLFRFRIWLSFPNLTFVSEYVTSPSAWCRRTWRTQSCRIRSSWCSSWAFCPFLFNILLLLSFIYFNHPNQQTNVQVPTKKKKYIFFWQEKAKTLKLNNF